MKNFIAKLLKLRHKDENTKVTPEMVFNDSRKVVPLENSSEGMTLITNHFTFENNPVKVHLAFTSQTDIDQIEQPISRQKLSDLMNDDQVFEKYLDKQYKLQSVVIVEGVTSNSSKREIFVSGSIPVDLKKITNGKRKSKEISIRGRLYKVDPTDNDSSYDEYHLKRCVSRTSSQKKLPIYESDGTTGDCFLKNCVKKKSRLNKITDSSDAFGGESISVDTIIRRATETTLRKKHNDLSFVKINDNIGFNNGKDNDRFIQMRKVIVPLNELRTSLTGFTKQTGTFHVVPWLTATYMQRKFYSNKEALSRIDSLYGFEKPKYEVYETNIQNTKQLSVKMSPIKYQCNQCTSKYFKNDKNDGIDNGSSSPESFISVISNVEHNNNKAMDCKINLDQNDKIPPIRNQNYDKLEIGTNKNNKSTFEQTIAYFENNLQSKPEISDASSIFDKSLLINECAMKDKTNSLKKKMDATIKELNGSPTFNTYKKKYVSVSHLNGEQSECTCPVNLENDNSKMESGDIVAKTNLKIEVPSSEEISLASITIKRSRTRIIKYDDGINIKEKVGRQTLRVEAPTGSLFSCDKKAWSKLNTNNADGIYSKTLCIKDKNNSCDNFKIQNNYDLENGNITSRSYERTDNNSCMQNVYHLNHPKFKSDYDQFFGDKFNPLKWLYSADSKNVNKCNYKEK